MEKGSAFLFSAVAGVAATCVITLVACSSDSPSTFGDGTVDASFDSSGGTFLIDSGSSGSGSDGEAGAQCAPTISDNFKAVWVPQHKQSVCSTTDLEAYFDNCLANPAAPDAGDICKSWRDAHDTCAKCIEPTENNGAVQWFENRYYYTLNVAGCIAIKQDKFADTDCGAAYNAAVQCQRDACEACFHTGTSTFKDFRNCENIAADTGLCKSLETQQASVCSGVKDTGTTTADCFKRASDTTDKQFYVRFEGIFCGQ